MDGKKDISRSSNYQSLGEQIQPYISKAKARGALASIPLRLDHSPTSRELPPSHGFTQYLLRLLNMMYMIIFDLPGRLD